jgi:hypothetical protein
MREYTPLILTVLLCLLAGLAVLGLLGGPVSDCVQLDEQGAELSVAAAFAIALLVWISPLKAVHLRTVVAVLALAMAVALLFQPTKMRMFRADVVGCGLPPGPTVTLIPQPGRTRIR